MISPVKMVLDPDNILLVSRIVLFQVFKEFNFYLTLLFKFLLAPDNFESNEILLFIVISFEDDSKTALPEGTKDVISVCDHVMCLIDELAKD